MKNNPVERLVNGIIKENPTLVLTLGMCPTLAVTTSAINGIGMGLSTTAVLMFSNLVISTSQKFYSGESPDSGISLLLLPSLVTSRAVPYCRRTCRPCQCILWVCTFR